MNSVLDFRKFSTYRTLSVERGLGSHALPNKKQPNPVTGYDARSTRPYSAGTVEHRKTKLYDFHVQLKGKMVPFGGYLLPVIRIFILHWELSVFKQAFRKMFTFMS